MDKNRVWLSEVRWTAKPDGLAGEFGTGTVLLFAPDGSFRMADCTLTRWNGTVAVSEGDGFVRYVGTWKLSNSAVLVKYSLDSPTRLVAKPHVTGPVREESLEVTGGKDRIQIVRSGSYLNPDRQLTKEALSFLLGI